MKMKKKLDGGLKNILTFFLFLIFSSKTSYSSQILDYETEEFVNTIIEEIVAVNSCHKSSDDEMRSRGLWVKPECRRQGITRKLFDAIFDEALSQQCKYVWSLPRKTALAAYEASGFVKTSDWLETETSEANCYVRKIL